MCKKYDYLIVGSGLFGSVFAHEATLRGKKCLVLERRDHVGGNIYCEEIEGVTVHRYGAHIFHTANRRVWKYVIVSRIHQSQIIKAKSTTCRSI